MVVLDVRFWPRSEVPTKKEESGTLSVLWNCSQVTVSGLSRELFSPPPRVTNRHLPISPFLRRDGFPVTKHFVAYETLRSFVETFVLRRPTQLNLDCASSGTSVSEPVEVSRLIEWPVSLFWDPFPFPLSTPTLVVGGPDTCSSSLIPKVSTESEVFRPRPSIHRKIDVRWRVIFTGPLSDEMFLVQLKRSVPTLTFEKRERQKKKKRKTQGTFSEVSCLRIGSFFFSHTLSGSARSGHPNPVLVLKGSVCDSAVGLCPHRRGVFRWDKWRWFLTNVPCVCLDAFLPYKLFSQKKGILCVTRIKESPRHFWSVLIYRFASILSRSYK